MCGKTCWRWGVPVAASRCGILATQRNPFAPSMWAAGACHRSFAKECQPAYTARDAEWIQKDKVGNCKRLSVRRRVTAMAASSPGDSLLASTADGIFHVNPADARGTAERLQTPSNWVTTSLEHNSRTGGFYASSTAGTIMCLSRMLW
jgi:hypothetical protein